MKKENSKAKEMKIIDAAGKSLGRIATEAAMHLMGKTSASFERNKYSGFPVKIVNAGKLRITPKKFQSLSHKRYSGKPGGLRVTPAPKTAEKKGMKELVRLATYQMLPGNKLRRIMMKNLEIEN